MLSGHVHSVIRRAVMGDCVVSVGVLSDVLVSVSFFWF